MNLFMIMNEKYCKNYLICFVYDTLVTSTMECFHFRHICYIPLSGVHIFIHICWCIFTSINAREFLKTISNWEMVQEYVYMKKKEKEDEKENRNSKQKILKEQKRNPCMYIYIVDMYIVYISMYAYICDRNKEKKKKRVAKQYSISFDSTIVFSPWAFI